MKIKIIVAIDSNNLIGDDNNLPWHLPEDLARFKKITTGNNILMGRKTYESIGHSLPNRTNIILTKKANKYSSNYDTFFIDSISQIFKMKLEGDLYVIGGAQIYEQLYDYTEFIHLTLVHNKYEGNVYLPFTIKDIEKDFNLVSKEEKDGFTYLDYERTLRGRPKYE